MNPRVISGGRQIFNSPTTEQDPNNWISSPGIYRLNFASGRITELNYDPSMGTYLMWGRQIE